MDDELKDLFFDAIDHFPLEQRDATQRWLKRRPPWKCSTYTRACARSSKPARMRPGKSMGAAGANILTCKLNCIVCSAARSGKPIFFNVAHTGLLCQMLPSGESAQTSRVELERPLAEEKA